MDESKTPGFAPKKAGGLIYPYIFQRTYLCGYPKEIIQVDMLPKGRLQHTILDPLQVKTRHILNYTLEKCEKCATEHPGQPNQEIAKDQGQERRDSGQKRDGFLESLNRYKCGGRNSAGVNLLHEKTQGGDTGYEDKTVLHPNGKDSYQRALRVAGNPQRSVEVSKHSGELVGTTERTSWGTGGSNHSRRGYFDMTTSEGSTQISSRELSRRGSTSSRGATRGARGRTSHHSQRDSEDLRRAAHRNSWGAVANSGNTTPYSDVDDMILRQHHSADTAKQGPMRDSGGTAHSAGARLTGNLLRSGTDPTAQRSGTSPSSITGIERSQTTGIIHENLTITKEEFVLKDLPPPLSKNKGKGSSKMGRWFHKGVRPISVR